jgi:hypothetical protein
MNTTILGNADDASDGYQSPAERQIRHAELRRQIEALGGEFGSIPGREVSPLEIQFMERVLMWETGASSSHRDWLARKGRRFPPPDQLTGDQLKVELCRLIRALAEARVFLEHTDHLSDAELYRRLWTDVLSAECPDGARTERDTCHWDFADPGENGGDTWLRYYADEGDRETWAMDADDDDALPPRETPPYDRDRHLPASS